MTSESITDVVLSLSDREYQYVLNLLVQRPWAEANDLIGKIVGQFKAQQSLRLSEPEKK